jgi:hypothetical protein
MTLFVSRARADLPPAVEGVGGTVRISGAFTTNGQTGPGQGPSPTGPYTPFSNANVPSMFGPTLLASGIGSGFYGAPTGRTAGPWDVARVATGVYLVTFAEAFREILSVSVDAAPSNVTATGPYMGVIELPGLRSPGSATLPAQVVFETLQYVPSGGASPVGPGFPGGSATGADWGTGSIINFDFAARKSKSKGES